MKQTLTLYYYKSIKIMKEEEINLEVPYCLKSNKELKFMISQIVTKEILTKELKTRGVSIGDYFCQWIDNSGVPQIGYFKPHLVEKYIKKEPLPPTAYRG
jgi:hypothetical protein